MYEKIHVTKTNYKDIFNSYKYGTKIITYESEEVRILFNQRITVINEFTGLWTMEEKIHVTNDVVDGEWVSTEVPNVYEVLYKNSREPLPLIDESNYNIEELACLAKKESIITVINNLEPSLIKYAKNMANKYNVRFNGTGFNGTSKGVSVRKQIEEAYLAGKYSISFPSSDFNSQTVRNYVSSFSSLIGKKIRVELKLGTIIVHFKNIEESSALFTYIKESHEKLIRLVDVAEVDCFLKTLISESKVMVSTPPKNVLEVTNSTISNVPETITEPAPFVHKLYGKIVSKEEYNKAKRWQRLGFASEYNWENEIEGDVDMFPKDVRIEDDDDDDDEVVEVPKYDWDSLEKEDEEHESNERKLDDDDDDF